MATIKPNIPPIGGGQTHYPYLAAVEVEKDVLAQCCIKEGEVVGISSSNAVRIKIGETEYDDVPVYIHTDKDCRQAIMEETEKALPSQYFETAALLFPMAGNISTSRGTTLTPLALVAVDAEGNPLFVTHVLSSVFHSFIESPESAPSTWYMYALVKVHNASYSITEYSLYDMVADTVASVPTYTDDVPELPLVVARRIDSPDTVDNIQPFLQRGFIFSNSSPLREAWHYVGCNFESASYGVAGEMDSTTYYNNVSQYPFSSGTGWIECNLGVIHGRRERSQTVDPPGYASIPWVETTITDQYYNVWTDTVLTQYDNAQNPNIWRSYKYYYEDETSRYFIAFRHSTVTVVRTRTSSTTGPVSVTTEELRQMYFAFDDSADIDQQVVASDPFVSTTTITAECIPDTWTYYKYTTEEDKYSVESLAYTFSAVRGCFVWSGAANITAVAAVRTQLFSVMENSEYTELEVTETDVVKCSLAHNTEDNRLITNLDGLAEFVNDVYSEMTADNTGVGLFIDVAFYLVPYDLRAGVL